MDEEQFKTAMETENPTLEEIANIVTERQKKSEEENKTAHENNEKARLEREQKEKEEQERLKYTNQNFATDDFLSNIFNAPKDESEAEPDNEEQDSSESKE